MNLNSSVFFLLQVESIVAADFELEYLLLEGGCCFFLIFLVPSINYLFKNENIVFSRGSKELISLIL